MVQETWGRSWWCANRWTSERCFDWHESSSATEPGRWCWPARTLHFWSVDRNSPARSTCWQLTILQVSEQLWIDTWLKVDAWLDMLVVFGHARVLSVLPLCKGLVCHRGPAMRLVSARRVVDSAGSRTNSTSSPLRIVSNLDKRANLVSSGMIVTHLTETVNRIQHERQITVWSIAGVLHSVPSFRCASARPPSMHTSETSLRQDHDWDENTCKVEVCHNTEHQSPSRHCLSLARRSFSTWSECCFLSLFWTSKSPEFKWIQVSVLMSYLWIQGCCGLVIAVFDIKGRRSLLGPAQTGA